MIGNEEQASGLQAGIIPEGYPGPGAAGIEYEENYGSEQ